MFVWDEGAGKPRHFRAFPTGPFDGRGLGDVADPCVAVGISIAPCKVGMGAPGLSLAGDRVVQCGVSAQKASSSGDACFERNQGDGDRAEVQHSAASVRQSFS